MKFSYWENKTWLSNIDFVIVGSGIVGLNCALQLRLKYPTSKIVILEKGLLPYGASTRNAGFACFGSLTEIISDLQSHSDQEVFELIKKRVSGLNKLRHLLGDKDIKYQQLGGNEIFLHNEDQKLNLSIDNLDRVNNLIRPLFDEEVFHVVENKFKFNNTLNKLIFNKYEGQIDTGEMMDSLLKKALSCGIRIINNVSLEGFEDLKSSVLLKTNQFTIKCRKLFLATNGFSNLIIQENTVELKSTNKRKFENK